MPVLIDSELRLRLSTTEALIPAVVEDMGNPSWERATSHILIVRLSPFKDIESSSSHLVLFSECRKALPEAFIDFAFFPAGGDRAVLKARKLPLYYGASDLYLSASHSDGSSVSLMEALASGLPVLVSDIPGNREWISEGEQGWLFPDGEASILADRIRFAAAGETRLADLGHAARALAERRANWDKNFQCLLQAYQMAVGQEFPLENQVGRA